MAGVSFDTGEDEVAGPCGLSLKIPTFTFGFSLPPIEFPPAIPFPVFGFALSCNPSDPIDITAGLEYGGSRVPRFEADPDASDT